jgi:hypothetical protein
MNDTVRLILDICIGFAMGYALPVLWEKYKPNPKPKRRITPWSKLWHWGNSSQFSQGYLWALEMCRTRPVEDLEQMMNMGGQTQETDELDEGILQAIADIKHDRRLKKTK